MGTNPFAAIAEFWSPLAMKVYIVLMILAVIIGTLFDVWHKGSAIYFAQRREKSKALARNPLGSGEAISLALATIAEAAVSGEFDKTPRRISHLLMMYGFLLNMITTFLMVFVYPTAHRPQRQREVFLRQHAKVEGQGPRDGGRRAGLDRRADRDSRRARLGRVL
ncbi:MAG: hypothetical protein E6H55_14595 [Betaproteobacteria bacterium]|nr:MAG: hypothetical protein E6H55_14595 [Betaproteobacteria bacterium]